MNRETLLWETIGTPDFPATVINTLQGSSHRHGHEFYEVVYVEEGFCLHFTGEHVDLLMAGDLIALAPGQLHSYRCRDNVQIWNILFMPEIFEGWQDEVRMLPGMAAFLDNDMDGVLHAHLSLHERQQLQHIISDIRCEQQDKAPGWALQMRAVMAELMVLMSRVFGHRLSLRHSENLYLGYALSAVARIEEGYQGNLTVGSLAAELGIGPDHFTRQFRQIMGITPTEYIRRYRFAKALELLQQQRPVSEVSRATGYRQLSYFSREFKSLFNMTPSAFQRQARERYR